jgi:acetyltransferase-like isoleucine patch superfamily enzyme
MLKYFAKLFFIFSLKLAYLSYKAEGLNAFFLILPAKLIVPTLQKYGAKIGQGVEMHSPLLFHNVSEIPYLHYSNLIIGSHCYFGRDVFLDLADKIIIEDNVTVSMRVTLLTHTHPGKSPLLLNKLSPSYAPIILKNGCYVGASVTILQGICIGENAIIGAGAVVTHNIPPNTTYAGVPAKLIK